MKYQTVSVSIHEKRNHPHEYGHFDASVSYTVQVEEGEDADQITRVLCDRARDHVEGELDAKVAQVNLEREREDARNNLRWIIERAKNGNFQESDADKFELHLIPLAEHERIEFNRRLVVAKEQYWAELREVLDEYIAKAERNTASSYDIDRFNMQVVYLPEAEQDGYRKRMGLALERAEKAAKANRPPVAIEPPGINDDPAALMRQLKEDEKNIPY